MPKRHQKSAIDTDISERRFPEDYRLDDGVWVPRSGVAAFDYSDGDEVERRLLRVVSGAKDCSVLSPELQAAITDWPSRYHLSALRANLLRPFTRKLAGAPILEIGAGCGAITRFLGEQGADVVAVEGSLARARIARARTRDLENVSVVCDNAGSLAPAPRFRAILLIGVLEYARTYLPGGIAAQDALLRSLGRSLAADGALIVAIENQLGLKYFAGAPEDHLARPYAGIDDQYRDTTPATFGKRELSRLLAAAGLDRQVFFYPFPDYKLPASIVADRCLTDEPGLAATLASASVGAEPAVAEGSPFSMEMAWTLAGRNGLIADLANSFVAVAGMSDAATSGFSGGALAWHYSVGARHPAFAKEARFEADGDDPWVRRSRLSAAAAPHSALTWEIADEPYRRGRIWASVLTAMLNLPEWQTSDVVAWCRYWLDALFVAMKEDGHSGVDLTSEHIPGRYIDALPLNLVTTADGQNHFIDQEWRVGEDIDLGFLIYRGLRASLHAVTSVAPPAAGTPLELHRLIEAVFAGLGLSLSSNGLRRHWEFEHRLQSYASGRTAGRAGAKAFRATDTAALRCRGGSVGVAGAAFGPETLAARERMIQQLSQELRSQTDATAERDRQLANADAELRRHVAASAATSVKLATVGEETRRLIEGVETREARLAEVNRKLTGADAEIRRLIADAESAAKQLTVADRETRRLLAAIEERDRTEAATNRARLSAEGKLEELTEQLHGRNLRILEVDAEMRTILAALEDNSTRLVEADKEIRRLTAAMAERDRVEEATNRARLSAEGKLAELTEQVHARNIRLGEVDAEIRHLTAAVQARDLRLQEVDRELRDLVAGARERDARLMEADQEMRRLIAALKENRA